MFGRVFGNVLRITLARRTQIIAAGGTSLGLSFFAASTTETNGIHQNNSKPRNFDLIVHDTDELYDNYLIDNCYNILRKFGSSDCSELLWRLARVVCEKSKLSKDPAEKKQLMLEAFEIVKKALANEPAEGCFGAHKWYGILLDYVGEIEGNKSRIEKAYEVREHLERALAIYDGDATTWHILGIWHFSFADMGYATRMVAKAIFATPPSSTYEQALHYFLKAEEISPNFYSTNTYYIAEVYERLGQKEKAVENYIKSFKMAVITSDDAKIHKQAHEKLRKHGVKPEQLV
ncbi:unnamed protein product [Caenorhabditis angaria]|uniref:Regulator of microtubule dynamics protein 1 n=1 Tax=Caenorhabditis angaria TaxID=860376 RepID=A0A9P1I3K3_9PELO|nr:unnamed protein product [Caenorhabditis angaria]